MTFGRALVLLAALAPACTSSLVPPRPVSTHELPCQPQGINMVTGGYRVKSLRGIVRTPDRPGEPGVVITVRPLGGGAVQASGTSDEKGGFALPDLPNGWYQLETCHPGLQSTVLAILVSRGAGEDFLEVYVHLAV